MKSALICSAWTLPWAFLIFHLSLFWTLAPDYRYGWAVVPLGAYLLYRRWTSSDVLMAGEHEAGVRGARWKTKSKGWHAIFNSDRGSHAVAAFFALLILPIWWIRGATPDWSAISYALTFTVVAYTLALMAAGSSWTTAWRVSFPVCFILCAVPWPQRAENAIIQTLTRMVAGGAVEALQWMGIGAVLQGNLVLCGNGSMEISDACSGIRSIQSMLLASLALGELYMLKTPRRIVLVGTGIAIALGLNLSRIVLLTLIANSSGLKAFERWHDPAGLAILLLSAPPLFLLARSGRIVRETAPADRMRLRPLPIQSAAALVIWFCAAAGGVEIWYRSHEWRATPSRQLEVHWRKEKANFEVTPIDDRTRDLLLCSDARSASWTKEDGTCWNLTCITWAPKQTSVLSARMHRPEVCFQATGAQFLGRQPPQRISIPGGTLLFEPLEFVDRRQSLYVFLCLYETPNGDDRDEFVESRWARVRRAFLGQRNLGQQTVELTIRGCPNYETALHAIRMEMPELFSLNF